MPDTLPALEARRSEILRQIGTLGDGVQPLFVFVLDILLHHNERVRKDFGRHPERDAVQRRFRLAFAASQVNFVSNYLHCIFILAVQPVGPASAFSRSRYHHRASSSSAANLGIGFWLIVRLP